MSPLARAEWIEIRGGTQTRRKKKQSPLARAEWIEIIVCPLNFSSLKSPLARAEWIEMPGPGPPAPQGLVSAHDRSEIYGDQNQKKGRRHTD